MKTRWLSYGDIIRLKSVEEMVEIYYNSGQFSHTVKAVVREFSDAFTFYEALGAFYEEKDYDTLSHSRIRRYEILLEFLEERGTDSLEFYKALMIFDLYARENMKTRPSWAAKRDPYKEKIQVMKGKKKIPGILQDMRNLLPGRWRR